MPKPVTVPYKPEYVPMLATHVAEGGHLKSFAKKIGVSYATTFRWTGVHAEFNAARKIDDSFSKEARGSKW